MIIGGIESRTVNVRLTPPISILRIDFATREPLMGLAMLRIPWRPPAVQDSRRPVMEGAPGGTEQFVPGFRDAFTRGTPYA